MRKGYGPTGVSFHYPLEAFLHDVEKGAEFKFELVMGGNTFSPSFDLQQSTESELRSFFDRADCLTLDPDGPRIHIIAN